MLWHMRCIKVDNFIEMHDKPQTFLSVVDKMIVHSLALYGVSICVRSFEFTTHGSHQKFKTKLHDFSLTSTEISLTILSTTDCRSISYVNILDKSQWWSEITHSIWYLYLFVCCWCKTWNNKKIISCKPDALHVYMLKIHLLIILIKYVLNK